MGKFWSGVRTLADGCRRLFKKTLDDEVGCSKDKTSEVGPTLDSTSQIVVKIFSMFTVSEACCEIVMKEIKAFQQKFNVVRENNIGVKGTLFLNLRVDVEDVTNVCEKLWRLSRSKIPEEQLINYCINISVLIIKGGNGITTSQTRSAVSEVKISVKNPESAINKVDSHDTNGDSKASKTESEQTEIQESNSKYDEHDDISKVSKVLGSEDSCAQVPKDPVNNVRSEAQAENFKMSQRAIDDETTQNLENQIDFQVIASKEDNVSQDAIPGAPETKSHKSHKTERKMGAIVNAEAVMRRLSRLLTNALSNNEWIEIDKSQESIELYTSLYKSFKTTGIIARVQDEIAGLKCNNVVWIQETMKKVRKSAKVVAQIHKLEFQDFQQKYPDLITLEKYLSAKENQLKRPKIRQKYIALILYGSLEKKNFFSKFPNLANEIISYDMMRHFIKLCVKNMGSKPGEIIRSERMGIVQTFPVNRYKSVHGKNKPGIDDRYPREIFLAHEEEAKEEEGETEVADLVDSRALTCSELNDDVKCDDDDEMGDETAEQEMGASTETVSQNKDKTRKNKRNKSNATVSASAGESAYEENWSFEKKGINSLDDRIRTKRYGKGSKRRFENVKVKVKTRGVANRHIAPTKQEVLLEDAPEVSKGDDIFQLCQNLLEDSGDCVGSRENIGGDKGEANLSCSEDTRDAVEEPDMRHIESQPSTIIMGKKLEVDDLGERYCATRSNKNRRQRKKAQRANKVLTIGDLNNSALVESDSDDLEENCDLSDQLEAVFYDYYMYDMNDASDSEVWTDLSYRRFVDENGNTTTQEKLANSGNLMAPRIVKDENILFVIY